MKIIHSLLFLFISVTLSAQVGIGTTNPDPSAVLDINSEISSSARGGLKLPTVANDTERGLIDLSGNPIGLIIYNRGSRCVEMYDVDTMSWVDVRCLPALPQTSVEFVNITSSLDENDGTGSITIDVEITNPSSTNATTVEVALTGTATNGVDFSSITSPVSLTFPAGSSTNQSITINLINDADTEGNETVVLTLQNIAGGNSNSAIIGTDSTHTFTINDDESPAGPVIIGIQNFETVSATPNLSFNELQNGSFQSGSGPVPSTDHFVSGSRGYGVSNNDLEIDFSSVDASSYNDVTLTFKLAAFGSSTNGLDTSDYVDVYISTDGGSTFSHELSIVGRSNSRWDFNASGTASIAYDGDNTETTIQAPSGGTISNGIATVTINGISNSSNLVVSIIASNNNSNERWVIDACRVNR